MFVNTASHIGAWKTDCWQQAFDECAEIGFQGVEFHDNHFALFEDRTEELQEQLKTHSMNLSAIEYNADAIYPDRKEAILKNALPRLQFLKAMKSNLLIFNTGQREILQDKNLDFKIAFETINDLGKICTDYDCHLSVITQMDSRIWNEEDIDRLLNGVDTNIVFLGIDTAHLHQAGCQPDRIIQTYSECLKHVRLQDVYPEHEEPKEGVTFAPLCEGCIRFRSVIRALDHLRYNGWMTITLDSPHDEPAEAFETSLQQLQEWIEKKDEPEPIDPFTHGGLSFR